MQNKINYNYKNQPIVKFIINQIHMNKSEQSDEIKIKFQKSFK